MNNQSRAKMTAATRLFDLQPESYDPKQATVDAVLSRGSPVKREYGTEQLEISPTAINLGRVFGAGVPILDSHQQIGIYNALGRLTNAWVADGALWGTIAFNRTAEGINAEGMVARKEINGISIGYRVAPKDWAITDRDGNKIDPAREIDRWRDDDLTFTATRWELLETSLVMVPADAEVGFRASLFDRALPRSVFEIVDIKTRMEVRQRAHERMSVRETRTRMIIRARMLARQHAHERRRCHV